MTGLLNTSLDFSSLDWSADPEFPTCLGCDPLSSSDGITTEMEYSVLTRLHLAGLCLSLVMGLSLNVAVLLAILPTRRLRATAANALLCHLAVASLILCGLLIWGLLRLTAGRLLHPMNDELRCKIHGSLYAMGTQVTVWTLTSLAWDKYRTISSPLRYHTIASRRRMALYIILNCCLALPVALLPLFTGVGYKYYRDIGSCDLPYSQKSAMWLSLLSLIITFFIPFLIISYCYWHLFRIARWQRQRIVTMVHLVTLSIHAPITHGAPSPVALKGRRASRTILLLLTAFVFCYFPYSLFSLTEIFIGHSLGSEWRAAVTLALHMAPAVNALVHGLKNHVVRDHFQRNVGRHLLRISVCIPLSHKMKSPDSVAVARTLQHSSHHRHRLHPVLSQPVISATMRNIGDVGGDVQPVQRVMSLSVLPIRTPHRERSPARSVLYMQCPVEVDDEEDLKNMVSHVDPHDQDVTTENDDQGNEQDMEDDTEGGLQMRTTEEFQEDWDQEEIDNVSELPMTEDDTTQHIREDLVIPTILIS